jgi:hypothetical protein
VVVVVEMAATTMLHRLVAVVEELAQPALAATVAAMDSKES